MQVIDTERPACHRGNSGIYGPVSYFQAAAGEENACGKKNHRKVAVALDKKDAVPGRIFAGVPFYAPHAQKSCSGQKKSEKTLCGKAVFKGTRCVEPGAEQEKAQHIRIGAEGIEYFQSFQGIYADQALGAECIQKHLQAGQAVGHQDAESGKKEYDFSSCLMIPGDAEQGEYKINRQQGFNKPQMARSDTVQAAKGEKIGKNLVPAKAQRRNLAERSDGKEIDKPPGNKYNINQDCFPDVFFQLQRPGEKQRPVYHKNMGTPDQQATMRILAGTVSESRTKWQKTTRKIEITLMISRYWILFCMACSFYSVSFICSRESGPQFCPGCAAASF